jgi:hypothetical protein
MKIPTPLNGWRVFAGEVGVIVLGVLLALGAQQAAETLQMRSEVREFRRMIDHEIGLNLYVYDVRTRSSDCNVKRIEELLAWVRKAKDGAILPRIDPYAPGIMYPYRSAWDSRDGNVFAAVPAKARQKYAEFYDELDGNTKRLGEERAEWLALVEYAIPGPISIQDRRTMLRHLLMARAVSKTWDSNMPVSKKIADELGIEPIRPDNISPSFLKELDICDPIFIPKESGITPRDFKTGG